MTTRDLEWHPDLRSRDVTVQRVEDIAFTPMPVQLRNDLITQAYGDLAEAMQNVVGRDNITWTNLGVWASNTIGGYLHLPIPVLGRLIARPFADGNRDVFADVGRAQALFLATVGRARGAEAIEVAWLECSEEMERRLLEPPGDSIGAEPLLWDSIAEKATRIRRPTNRLLMLGFEAYKNAALCSDDDRKAQFVLVGNLLVAIHEQRLLSTPISIGFRSWLRTLLSVPRPFETNRSFANRPPGARCQRIEDRWISFATRRFVGVDLADENIRVGGRVPRGSRPVPIPPDLSGALSGIDASMSPAQMLGQIYAELDVDGSPAVCWNDLPDRMAYIASLFEQHQRSDIWHEADGRIRRPSPRKGHERDLRHLEARVAAAPEHLAPDPECPLSDEYLDSLRLVASHPELDRPDQLTMESFRNAEARRSVTSQIRADTQARLVTITGTDGLLSPAVARRSRTMFSNWSILMQMGLLFRSLPDAYAAARGVKVLGTFSTLATDSFRRAGETVQFVSDLLESDRGWRNGEMRADGWAFESVLGVRCLHSMVSGTLREDGWDVQAFGVPMNQEDILGTALSFAIPPFEMIEELGLHPSMEVRDAYVSFWLGIGHLLGAPIEAVTVEISATGTRRALTYDEGRAVAAAIRRRHQARSFDGVRLTEALLVGVSDGFPRWFDWLANGFMQVLGDTQVNELLLAGNGRGRRRARGLAWLLRTGLGWRFTRRLTRSALQAGGRLWLQPFAAAGSSRPYRHPGRVAAAEHAPVGSVDTQIWPVGCGHSAG